MAQKMGFQLLVLLKKFLKILYYLKVYNLETLNVTIFLINLIATLFVGSLLTSCKSKTENFDLDFSNLKIPNKSTEKILNPDISNTLRTNNKITKNQLINYQNKSEILNSVILGKDDPFSEGEIKVNNLTSDFKLTFPHYKN